MTPEQALGEILTVALPLLKIIVIVGCFVVLMWFLDRMM